MERSVGSRVGSRSGSVGPAALLVLSEAAWVSLAFDAFADGTAGPHRPGLDLPYLAFALPALAALLVGAFGRARGRTRGRTRGRGDGRARARPGAPRRWTRRVVVAAVVVAGTALSAGLVAGLSAPAATWSVALHPWAIGAIAAHTLVAQRAARWAWTVAVLAWVRGIWLGLSPPSLRGSVTSLLVGAAVLVDVFAHQAGAGSVTYRRVTGSAGWLLFVYFPLGVTGAAWAHQRDVERRVLRRQGTVPSGAWLAVLTAPLALVALVALVVGGAGGVVGPAAATVARAAGAVLGATGDWIFSHLPQIPLPKGKRLKLATSQLGRGHRPHASSGHPSALGIAVLCVLGLLVLVVLAVVVRALVRWARRRRPEVEVEEERESVFTWGHLGAQLRHALLAALARIAGLFGRRRPPKTPLVAPGPAPSGPTEGDPVRAAYRRLLAAARGAGKARSPGETPRELAVRLAAAPDPDRLGTSETRSLRSLTALYEGVRYAGTGAGPFAEQAAADADVLVRALCPVPAGRDPVRVARGTEPGVPQAPTE